MLHFNILIRGVMTVDYMRFLSSRSNWIEKSLLADIMKKASDLRKSGKKLIFLSAGDPDPNLIPREELARIAMEVLSNEPRSVLYTPVNGIPELREELSKFLRRYDGIDVPPDDIIITVGGTGAIDLLGRVLIDPGDIVITENPSYINTLLAFRQLGARIIGAPMDDKGLIPEKVEEIINRAEDEGKKVKLIYTIPTGQNPMGVTMSESRRRELLDIACDYNLLIMEDMAYNYLIYEDINVRTLKSLDREGRVISVGTLSKVLGTGFRVGWIIAEDVILQKVLMEKQPIDFCAPAISQFIALEYLRNGLFERYHIKVALPAYRRKRDALIRALEENLPDLRFTRPVAGMFSMLSLPEDVDGVKFAEGLMTSQGVVVVPGAPFYTDNTGLNTIRLNFSRPSVEEIENGIKMLSEYLRKLSL